MSGETEKDISGWTVDTLHSMMMVRFNLLNELLDERKAAQEKAMDAALAAAEKAVVKAEVATEKRFDAVNEFRQTLSDQATHFIARSEYLTSAKGIDDKMADIKARLDKQEGKGVGLNAGWIYLLGVIAAIGTVVSVLIILF